MSKEEYGLVSCNAVQFGESSEFQRNILSPSLGLKIKPSKKQLLRWQAEQTMHGKSGIIYATSHQKRKLGG